MGLITCPDCGRRVSDAATACPACGYPVGGSSVTYAKVQTVEQTGKKFKAVSAIAVVAIFVGLFLCMQNCGTGTQELPVAGLGLMLAGLLVYIVNRINIWWHHE